MSAATNLINELKRRNILKVVTAYSVTGFIILQLCDIVFPALNIADEVIGTVLVVLILGLPLVAAFAWMFEITPDGLRRTREVDQGESISHFTGQRINTFIIILLSVALAFFAWEYFNPDPPAAPVQAAADVNPDTTAASASTEAEPDMDTRPSIAVLPFVNMSSDQENEYFSDGLSEEVLNLLAQIPNLRVAGRTSSFFYKNKNEKLPLIGKALNVEHILEGSVRKSGNTVRITAQLISASDGFHLWSKTYDRELDNIFAVQDEIAGEVTRAMEVTLLTDGVVVSDRATTNPETYDLYLRARKALYDRGVDNVRLSVDLFKQAISHDPEYSPAYVDLAVSELLLNWNYGIRSVEESLANAAAALEKAESLGSLTSDYYAVLGLYHSNSTALDDSHFDLAEANFKQAIEMNPNNVRAYMWWSTLLSSNRSTTESNRKALELNQEARKLDPLNRIANGNHANLLASVGETARAIEDLNRLIKVDPDYAFYHGARTGLHMAMYELDKAAVALATVSSSTRQYPFFLLSLFFAFNDTEGAVAALSTIPADNPTFEFIELIEFSQRATAGELRAEAEVILLKPDPDFYGFPITFGLMNAGEYALVKQLIENARVDYTSDMPITTGGNGPDARLLYLSTIFLLGEVDRARRYAEKLLAANSDSLILGTDGKGISDAYCHLVLGNNNAAIETLEQAVATGWLGYYQAQLEDDPLWRVLIADPRVKAAKLATDQALARQKNTVYDALRSQGVI